MSTPPISTKAQALNAAHAAARAAEDAWYLELRRRYPEDSIGALVCAGADRGVEGSKLRQLWDAKIEAVRSLHACRPFVRKP